VRGWPIFTVSAFGSRVRGDALSSSDPDLVLVSPWFSGLPFLKQPRAILEVLDFPGDLELLGYTPEEFAEKWQEFSIVRVAVAEGITL
jgi:predicted nucleotidyltransferase